MAIPDFTYHNQLIDTVYGRMIVNRNAGEFDALAKCGKSPAHEAIDTVCMLASCNGEDSIAVDVGACFGTFTLPLARTLRAGRVFSFEPQRWLYRCIQGTLALNDIDNATVRNMAVGHEDGRCTVPRPDYKRGGAHYGCLPIVDFATDKSWADYEHERPAAGDEVTLVRLDSYPLPPPGLIKIDTEGMELYVLRGAEETIQRARPVLFVEHIKCDEQAMVAWLEERGYLTYVDGCDYIGIPREKRHKFPKISYEKNDAITARYAERDANE